MARVHWNLHKGGYSISVSGQPVQYADAVEMVDCVFHVDEKLRAQFEAHPNRRTVHALIKGRVVGFTPPASLGERVRCNPFLFRGFCRASDEVRVLRAERVALYADRHIEATGLTLDGSVDIHCRIER